MEKEKNKKNKTNSNEGVMLNGKDESSVDDTSLIEEAFGESIEYEEISEIVSSPINQPVKEGEVSDGFASNESNLNDNISSNENEEEDLPEGLLEEYEESLPPKDAPEQVINEQELNDENNEQSASSPRSPIDNADQLASLTADSFIGIANQVLEIGGGFYIKIKRTKSHIYFDELLERANVQELKPIGDKIDVQNTKNINRIKLDPSDVALLKPIIMAVLKSQTKQMTPEQQLAAVAISIAVKKAQAIVQIKAENKLFVQQLDQTIERYCIRMEQSLEKEEDKMRENKNESKKEEKTADKKAA